MARATCTQCGCSDGRDPEGRDPSLPVARPPLVVPALACSSRGTPRTPRAPGQALVSVRTGGRGARSLRRVSPRGADPPPRWASAGAEASRAPPHPRPPPARAAPAPGLGVDEPGGRPEPRRELGRVGDTAVPRRAPGGRGLWGARPVWSSVPRGLPCWSVFWGHPRPAAPGARLGSGATAPEAASGASRALCCCPHTVLAAGGPCRLRAQPRPPGVPPFCPGCGRAARSRVHRERPRCRVRGLGKQEDRAKGSPISMHPGGPPGGGGTELPHST